MSEPKFTKGPWKSVQREYHIAVCTAYDCFDGEDNIGPETICVIGGLPTIPLDGGKEWVATGDLIAAAPDMYKALECACDKYCIGYAGDSLVKCEDCVIQKALRKARGETE